MLRRFCVLLLCCGVMAACNRSDDSGSKSAADWAKVGETDGYVYYADHASIKKADEIVTMSDLFDYKAARTEGGGALPFPRKPIAGMTARIRRASRSRQPGIPARWAPGL